MYITDQVCAECENLTTKDYPEHRARGEGRCTGYDGGRIQLRDPFVPWNLRACALFEWAKDMKPRTTWMAKWKAHAENNEVKTETKG